LQATKIVYHRPLRLSNFVGAVFGCPLGAHEHSDRTCAPWVTRKLYLREHQCNIAQLWHFGPIWVIAGMSVIMMPEDLRTLHQKDAGHLPRVTDWLADGVALYRGADRTGPDARAGQLPQTALVQTKSLIELFAGIRDCPSLGPECAKERFPIGHSALIDKEHWWIGGIARHERAQVFDGLAAENSAKVTEKYQKGRL